MTKKLIYKIEQFDDLESVQSRLNELAQQMFSVELKIITEKNNTKYILFSKKAKSVSILPEEGRKINSDEKIQQFFNSRE